MACARSRTAADTAQVIPRSLNEPVGLAPSSLRCTSTPASSDRTGAGTSGVDPSCSVTIGSPALNGRRSLNRSMSGTLIGGGCSCTRSGLVVARSGGCESPEAGCRSPSDELLLHHPDRSRRRADEVQCRDQLDGGKEL